MTKIIKTIILGLVCTAFGALPLFAQTGNGAPSGAHYSLNIIGVEKEKNPPMSGSDRHTIFVALGKNEQVTSRIYLTPGEDFQVCDGNAFDPVHGCDGELVTKPTDGALFQLPCNTNIALDPDNPDETTLVPCDINESAAYEVWARALGSPKGTPSATITTCAFDVSLGAEVCSTENVVLVRETGKSTFRNVTQELTSFTDGTTRTALFAGDLEDWFWQYANNGLRLAQIRFYFID
jgi:hypothetical protein